MSKRLGFSHFTPQRPLALSGQAMTPMRAERLFFGWLFLCTPSHCGRADVAHPRFCGRKAVSPSLVLGYCPAGVLHRPCRKRLPETPETPANRRETVTVAEATLGEP